MELNKLFRYDYKEHIYDIFITTEIYKELINYPKKYSIYNTKRLDVVAWEYYGNPDYYVYLAIYNNVIDPIYPPKNLYIIPYEHFMAIINGEDWRDINVNP